MESGLWFGEILELLREILSDGGGVGLGFEGIFYLDALCKSGVHEFLTLLLF